MTTPVSGIPTKKVPNNDPEYAPFLGAVVHGFADARAGLRAVFTVETDGLWDLYLGEFPESDRQTYNCNACRHFVERFGGLVSISPDGHRRSLLWDLARLRGPFLSVANALRAEVERRPVSGVFVTEQRTLGSPLTGLWKHLAVQYPVTLAHSDRLRTPFQVASGHRENWLTVDRALEDYTPAIFAEALRIFEAGALARSEKFVGPVKWLVDLHAARETTKDDRRRAAILWRAVATAPEGYCHPRASVIGPLLDAIKAGKTYEQIKREFNYMLNPLQYQRPQAAPTAGNIREAERIFETLGLAPSLERRFARLDECETIWPAKHAPHLLIIEEEVGPHSPSVFGHLKPKDTPPDSPTVRLPQQVMTWAKFRATILPSAQRVDVYAPYVGPYIALTTATNADAPPIIRWDNSEHRNPVAWYVYARGSRAEQWRVEPDVWTPLTGIVPFPNLWGEHPAPHFADGAIFVISGAVDIKHEGLGLVPEALRDELHAVRATIEAHSKTGNLTDAEQASACGLEIRKGMQTIDLRLRVHVGGTSTDYRIDRWD